MTDGDYREQLRRLAERGDWQQVEQLTRRYGVSLLGRALRRTVSWVLQHVGPVGTARARRGR